MKNEAKILGGGGYNVAENGSITTQNNGECCQNAQHNYLFLQNSKNRQFAKNYKYDTKFKNKFVATLFLIMCLLSFLPLSNFFYVTNINKYDVDAAVSPLPYQNIYLKLPDPKVYGLEGYDNFCTIGEKDGWVVTYNDTSVPYACIYPYGTNTTVTTTIPFDLLGEIYGRSFQLTYNGVEYNIDNPNVTFTGLSSSSYLLYSLTDIGSLAVSYNITYLDQGGGVFSGTLATNSPTQYTEGEGTTLLSPTRDGYDFEGWYDNIDCTGNPITEISTSDSGDKTFYAKWKVHTITITLSANLIGENYILYVYNGEEICKQIYVDSAKYSFELDWVSDYNNDYKLAFVFGAYGNLTFATGNGVNTNISTNNRIATILTLADTNLTFTLANPRINSTIFI